MGAMEVVKSVRPHAVIFPFAALGHVRPLVQLARRLAHVHGFRITFVVTSYFYRRMDFTDSKNGEESILYIDLEEGFPDSYYHMTAAETLALALSALGPSLRTLLGRIHPVTCMISDQLFDAAHRAALHHNIPSVAFVTHSAMAVAATDYGSCLIEEGLLPLPKSPAEAKERLSQLVTSLPGMHPTMKLGDYHEKLLVSDLGEPFFQFLIGPLSQSLREERAWILGNSVYELEASVLDVLHSDAGVKLTTIGPLAVTPMAASEPFDDEDNKTSSYWPEDTSCMDWLDSQPPTSVVYVSFGSYVTVDAPTLETLLLGLEDSRVPFLMVMRPDFLVGSSFSSLQTRTRDRARFVAWAPQLRILSHPAIAGFVTHGGCNSFLESTAMGVPLLCHPFFVEQPMNSRYIASVWKVGLELKRTDGSLDSADVAAKIRALAAKESEIRSNARAWKDVVRGAVAEGGSSQRNMLAFVADMCKRAQTV